MKVELLTAIPGTPRSSFGHVIANGYLYIIGGHPGEFHQYSQSNFSNEVHAYDIKSNKWVECRPLPRSVQGLRAVFNGHHIYTFGGFSYEPTIAQDPWPARSLDQVYRYTPDNDTWEEIATMPRRRSSYVCELVGSKVYLIGGWDGTPRNIGNVKGEFVSLIDVFDVSEEKFIPSCLEFSPLPLRRAFTSTLWGSRVVLVGGLGYEGYMNSDLYSDVVSIEFPSTECQARSGRGGGYDPGNWSLLGQLPLPLFSPGVGTVRDTLLVAGGLGPVLEPHRGISRAKLLVYEQSERSWKETPMSMSEGKSFVEVEELPDGRTALIGGHRGFESDRLPTEKIEVIEW